MIAKPLKAQTIDTTFFPLNDHLYTNPGSPYPLVKKNKLTPNAIHKTKFVNVMDYGAKGDGITLDDNAIANAFRAAQYGVIFPSGKTFMVSKISVITLTHDLTVYAYGATIKMAPFSKYSFLSLQYQHGSYHNKVMWLGGTMDGNKNNQSWPGSPTGNTAWEEDHGRFVGVNFAQYALFKDVTLINIVMDGIGLQENRIGVISDCKASGGAPIKYPEVGDQGTYFKCTGPNSHAFYCINLHSDGGCIGVHYSTPNNTSSDSSITVVNNCTFYNQSQDALHFEDCKKIFLYKTSIGKDATPVYNAHVHISNATNIVSIKSCQLKNARLDFNNSSSLKLGIIDNCQFVSEVNNNASTFVTGRPTVCINSSFSGKTALKYQAELKDVRKCTFTNFDTFAISGGYAVDSCAFTNGLNPASLAKDGFIINSTFTNIQKDASRTITPNNDWNKIYLSYINIYDNSKNFLGQINCGGNAQQTSQNMAAASAGSIKTLAVNNDSLKINSISLYPNPTAEALHINLNEKIRGKTLLNIYNQQGNLVQAKIVNKDLPVTSETIDVKNLISAAYVLQIVNGDKKSSYKFIVSK